MIFNSLVMDPLVQTLLLVAIVSALPSVLLFVYRRDIPVGALWAVIACQFAFPVFGWGVALWAALREWQ